MKKVSVTASGYRFSVTRRGNEVGHAYLYLLKNDLHDRPFGFLEDVYVDSNYRSEGVAKELLEAVLSEAKKVATSSLLLVVMMERDNQFMSGISDSALKITELSFA